MENACKLEANSTLTAALELARRGFKIFPAKARDKKPAIAGWQKAATVDEDQITQWFSQDDLNIGVKTGRETSLLVVDIDPKNGGDTNWNQLCADLDIGDVPTLTCRTGGGGRHLYYALPEGLDGRVKGPAPFLGYGGVDIRADGNLVIGPGSVHANGNRYEFVDPTISLAPVPRPILDHLIPRRGKLDTTGAPGSSIPEGGRNDTLHREATRLRLHGLAQDEVLAAISQMNEGRCRPPLSDDEVDRLVKSAFTWTPTVIPKTHIEAAENFANLIRGQAVWVPEEKAWRVFNGRVWEKDITGDVERRIKGWAKLLIEHAESVPGGLGAELTKLARRLGQAQNITAITNLTKSEDGIAVPRANFDQHPDLVSTSNCVLRFLPSGNLEVREHRPDDLLTKNLDVEYDPNATAPVWHRFLERTFDNDASMIAFVKRAAGYSMLGEVREQTFFVGYGVGRNGKNSFIDAIAHVLGPYGRTVASGSFLKGKTGIRSDIAGLAGVRFAYTSELPEGQAFDAALLKSLTGDAKISARFLYGNEFEFAPTAKHWFVTNHLPDADADDFGLWRRLVPIPFTIVIPDEETDALLPEKLRAEAPGILRWLVEGAADWFKTGKLAPPTSITDARHSYRQDVDVLGSFLYEECQQGDSLQVGASDLFQRFRFWATSNGHPYWSIRRFKESLQRKQFRQRKTNKGQVWVGLHWKPRSC